MLPHVLYSSDMSPPDFDLFPKLKVPMHEEDKDDDITVVCNKKKIFFFKYSG